MNVKGDWFNEEDVNLFYKIVNQMQKCLQDFIQLRKGELAVCNVTLVIQL